MLELMLVGLIAAFLTHFINYIIGKPGSKEFSPYEIFSNYTVWLSKRRLMKVDLYKTYANQYNDNLNRTDKRHEVITLQNDFNKMLYEAAEPFFSWERAFGMCPVCTGFWISLIYGLFITFNIVDLGIVIIISHVVIRLLSKVI